MKLVDAMNAAADAGTEDKALDSTPLSRFADEALNGSGLALYWLRRKIGRLSGEVPPQGTAPQFLQFWSAEGAALAHFGDHAIATLYAVRLRQGAYTPLQVAA